MKNTNWRYHLGVSVWIFSLCSALSLLHAEAQSLPSDYDQDPDPVQGLNTFLERQGVKPYDLFWEGGERRVKKSPRLLYTDREHGTEIVLLGDSPLAEHAMTASVFPSWNADGSLLHLRHQRKESALLSADFSRKTGWFRLSMRQDANSIRWDRRNPDLAFYQPARGSVAEINIRTGERRLIAEWPPHQGERLHLFPEDDRFLWLETPNGGLWMTYEPGPEPIGAGPWIDGRPAGPNPDGSPHHPERDAKTYNVWRPDKRRPALPESEYGPMIKVRVGKRIDRETGATEKIIAPISSLPAYLRVFTGENGRLLVPVTPEWAEYGVHSAETAEEMYEIYRSYPLATHGHTSRSPDRHFEVDEGGTLEIYDLHEGKLFERMVVSSNPDITSTYHYHIHWDKHPRFFVGWIRGWRFESYSMREDANLIYQGFTDGTWQPVFNTKHRINSYYNGGDFSMQSPDATKIHTATNMTGLFRNIVAIMARPRPPEALMWQADEDAVILSWKPSQYSRETKGWLVYRSERSGDGYELLTPAPVKETQWIDSTVKPGEPYYYVVSSLEHSGLESGYSSEAARAGVGLGEIDAPLVVYAETEAALWDLGTTDRPGLSVGRDRLAASDWYYLYRHPRMESGSADLAVHIPVGEEYQVWARVRGGGWTLTFGRDRLEAASDSLEWTWVRAGGVKLEKGLSRVNLATSDTDAQLDLIALATDSAFRPEGPRPERRMLPYPVAGLHAENIRERVNRLAWDPSPEPGLSHYNVYASRDGKPSITQEFLISSPVEPELIDWGLKSGERYSYAVTAVDRRGNESKSVFAEASTPPRVYPEAEIELFFAEARTTGKFQRSPAAGLRGREFIMPTDGKGNRVEWDIEIPHEGDYFLWLRYLPGGDGKRGDLPEHNIHVLLDGEPLMRLGAGLRSDGSPLIDSGIGPDLVVDDNLIEQGHPLAPHVWTWARPASVLYADNPESVRLPAGRHTLSLTGLSESTRYDVMLVTDEPSFRPPDGRLRGNN
jgi:hypothetical protein